jgi:DNA-binding MarR family transcriptional regulator
VAVPPIGTGYRGADGHIGYLIRQAWHSLRGAMNVALRPLGLTAPQYGVLSVLAREGRASGADLARAVGTTPQAMNGVLATLERDGLVERTPHATHGRILEAALTDEGRVRLERANPVVRRLERALEDDLSPEEAAVVKRWLVAGARRMDAAAGRRRRS